jgi:hypothetical protein
MSYHPIRCRHMCPTLGHVGICSDKKVLEFGPRLGTFTADAMQQVGARGVYDDQETDRIIGSLLYWSTV